MRCYDWMRRGDTQGIFYVADDGIRICDVHRLAGGELREYERGEHLFRSGEPATSCKGQLEFIGWQNAREDQRLQVEARSRLILPPRIAVW